MFLEEVGFFFFFLRIFNYILSMAFGIDGW